MVAPAAMELLVRHPWHGNIRELKNVIERIMILEDKESIDVRDLPGTLRVEPPLGPPAATERPRITLPLGSLTLDQMEREAIRAALEQTGNNQVRAARLLGVTRDTLRYRLKKFGLGHALRA
jgi:DNA-binding NtrC family response regulator